MSGEETSAEVWKTIRISATTYYKLIELSGLLTALFGAKVPMSYLAEGAIIEMCDKIYPKTKKLLMNPDAVKEARKKWKEFEGELRQLLEVLAKL